VPSSESGQHAGTALSLYDPVADQYGTMRFGHGEAFHGAC
jgi:hypothetical protein